MSIEIVTLEGKGLLISPHLDFMMALRSETQVKMNESVVLNSRCAVTPANPAFSGFFTHAVVMSGICALF